MQGCGLECCEPIHSTTSLSTYRYHSLESLPKWNMTSLPPACGLLRLELMKTLSWLPLCDTQCNYDVYNHWFPLKGNFDIWYFLFSGALQLSFKKIPGTGCTGYLPLSSGICSSINRPSDDVDVISIDYHGVRIVPKLQSLETNKTNITNRISLERGAGAEQSFLCPGKLMIKDGGMIQCDHLLLITKKGKWTWKCATGQEPNKEFWK